MKDEDVLLAAILADPADDLARLAWADCQEEKGDPIRAAFVRAQVQQSLAYAALEECWKADLAPGDRQRQQASLAVGHAKRRVLALMAGRPSWLWPGSEAWDCTAGTACATVDGGGDILAWRRGFLWRAVCGPSFWMKHGPALVRQHPFESGVEWKSVVSRRESPAGDRWRVHRRSMPHAVWERFVPEDSGWEFSGFDSYQEAAEAVSRAALAWARAEEFSGEGR